jgi:predicted dehydrogenase
MTLGIGLIGYGSIGRVHAMGYRSIPFYYGLPADTFRLVGVSTSRPETAEAAAREIGCDVWTGDYRGLLARDDIHVVDICVPNRWHEEVVLAAAEAGKHIYCEKPLAMDLAQARRMAEAVRRSGVKNQMTFNFRFFPAVLRAQQLMAEGFVGRVFSFRGRYHRSSYIDPAKPLSWRLRRDVAGGGALFDIGSHLLDLFLWLLGDVAEVQATLETFIKERPLVAGSAEKGVVDVDDIALLQMRLKDGALGLADVSRMGTGATNDLEVEIFGQQGAIRFALQDPNWLYVYDVREADRPYGGQRGFRRIEAVQHFDGQVIQDWSQPMSFTRSHVECQYRFLKAVLEDRTPSPTVEDGLRVQEIMEAIRLSSNLHRWVQLDDPALLGPAEAGLA